MHDKLQAEATAAAGKAMVEAMRPMLAENSNKLMKLLHPHELECMVVAAIGAYLQVTERQRRELNDPISDLAVFS